MRAASLTHGEATPFLLQGNRFRRAIHAQGLSLWEVAPVNHVRPRSAESTDRFDTPEVDA